MSVPVVELVAAIGLGIATLLVARWRLGAGLAVAVAALALGGSSVDAVRDVFQTARWGPLAALALVPLLDRRIPRRPAPTHLLAGGAVAVAAISAAWSVDPRLTVARAASFAVVIWIAFLVVAPAVRRAERHAIATSLAVVASAALVASVVVWVIAPDRALASNELRGIFENANGFGLFVALLYPFARFSLDRRAGSVPAAVSVLPVAVVVALSGSRSGLLALVVAVAAYEAPFRRWGRLVTQLAASAVIIAGFAAWAPILPGARTATDAPPDTVVEDPADPEGETPPTDAPPVAAPPLRDAAGTLLGTARPPNQAWLDAFSGSRFEAWDAAGEIIARRPVLGFGFGTGDRLFTRFEYGFRFYQGANPANAYLQTVMELGVVAGFVLLLPVLVAAVVSLSQLARTRRTVEDAVFAAVLLAGLAAAVVESLLAAAGAPWALIVWSCAAVVLTRGSQPAAEPAPVATGRA